MGENAENSTLLDDIEADKCSTAPMLPLSALNNYDSDNTTDAGIVSISQIHSVFALSHTSLSSANTGSDTNGKENAGIIDINPFTNIYENNINNCPNKDANTSKVNQSIIISNANSVNVDDYIKDVEINDKKNDNSFSINENLSDIMDKDTDVTIKTDNTGNSDFINPIDANYVSLTDPNAINVIRITTIEHTPSPAVPHNQQPFHRLDHKNISDSKGYSSNDNNKTASSLKEKIFMCDTVELRRVEFKANLRRAISDLTYLKKMKKIVTGRNNISDSNFINNSIICNNGDKNNRVYFKIGGNNVPDDNNAKEIPNTNQKYTILSAKLLPSSPLPSLSKAISSNKVDVCGRPSIFNKPFSESNPCISLLPSNGYYGTAKPDRVAIAAFMNRIEGWGEGHFNLKNDLLFNKLRGKNLLKMFNNKTLNGISRVPLGRFASNIYTGRTNIVKGYNNNFFDKINDKNDGKKTCGTCLSSSQPSTSFSSNSHPCSSSCSPSFKFSSSSPSPVIHTVLSTITTSSPSVTGYYYNHSNDLTPLRFSSSSRSSSAPSAVDTTQGPIKSPESCIKKIDYKNDIDNNVDKNGCNGMTTTQKILVSFPSKLPFWGDFTTEERKKTISEAESRVCEKNTASSNSIKISENVTDNKLDADQNNATFLDFKNNNNGTSSNTATKETHLKTLIKALSSSLSHPNGGKRDSCDDEETRNNDKYNKMSYCKIIQRQSQIKEQQTVDEELIKKTRCNLERKEKNIKDLYSCFYLPSRSANTKDDDNLKTCVEDTDRGNLNNRKKVSTFSNLNRVNNKIKDNLSFVRQNCIRTTCKDIFDNYLCEKLDDGKNAEKSTFTDKNAYKNSIITENTSKDISKDANVNLNKSSVTKTNELINKAKKNIKGCNDKKNISFLNSNNINSDNNKNKNNSTNNIVNKNHKVIITSSVPLSTATTNFNQKFPTNKT